MIILFEMMYRKIMNSEILSKKSYLFKQHTSYSYSILFILFIQFIHITIQSPSYKTTKWWVFTSVKMNIFLSYYYNNNLFNSLKSLKLMKSLVKSFLKSVQWIHSLTFSIEFTHSHSVFNLFIHHGYYWWNCLCWYFLFLHYCYRIGTVGMI